MSDTSAAINYALTPKEIEGELIACISEGIVPYVKGSPGIAKSAIGHKIARNFQGERLKLIDCRLSGYNPEDINGFPMKLPPNKQNNVKAGFVPFSTFPVEGDEVPDGYAGWLLFLDELSSASKPVQASSYKLILDRFVGDHPLHPAVAIIAAGNKDSDKAVTVKMSTALQSRMIHYEMKVGVPDWIEWAITEGEIDDRIVSFMSFKPDLLMNFKPDHTDNTFACPRTWHFLSKMIKGRTVSTQHLPMMARVAGTVGSGAATDFISFCEAWEKLPTMTQIIDNPDAISIREMEPSTKYAVIGMMVSRHDESNIEALVKFVKKFSIELQVVFMRGVNARNPKLRSRNAEFGKYLMTMVRYL